MSHFYGKAFILLSRTKDAIFYIINKLGCAKKKKGGLPDTMFAITNMLVVSTTPHNHMRMERFFDSIPKTLGEQPKAWIEMLEEKKRAE